MEQDYLSALSHVLNNGVLRSDRTGTGTIGVFGQQQRYDLSKSFPAITTKKLAFRAVVSELLWFIEGSGDERRLAEILHGTRDANKNTIWTANAQAPYWLPKAKFPGDLGNVYGVMWRSWPAGDTSVDQLSNLIDGIRNDPYGRRHIISAWNPGELANMALPPCHCLVQFYVSQGKLSCQLYQRSADWFLGVPFNIASYALFTHMIAQVCGLGVGEFVHTTGDAHIYTNHIAQVTEQLQRAPLPPPSLRLNTAITDITKFTMQDIELVGYQSHASITAPMAV
jgi:thymidylate synthase